MWVWDDVEQKRANENTSARIERDRSDDIWENEAYRGRVKEDSNIDGGSISKRSNVGGTYGERNAEKGFNAGKSGMCRRNSICYNLWLSMTHILAFKLMLCCMTRSIVWLFLTQTDSSLVTLCIRKGTLYLKILGSITKTYMHQNYSKNSCHNLLRLDEQMYKRPLDQTVKSPSFSLLSLQQSTMTNPYPSILPPSAKNHQYFVNADKHVDILYTLISVLKICVYM